MWCFMNMKSFRTRILVSFFLVAVIPTIVISAVSMGYTVNIVERNVTELTQNNLEQVNKNLELTLSGYEDLLLQLYTDDETVELVENINSDNNTALSSSQLLRKIREVSYTKPYIESIMVIPAQKEPIFFDKLTAASTKSSWIDSYAYSIEDIYDKTISSPWTVIFPTSHAFTIIEKEYYLFHMAHRLIDYRHIDEEVGIVVFSINRDLLDELCNEGKSASDPSGINFITNENDIVMSFPENQYVGTELSRDEEDRNGGYEEFVENTDLFGGGEVMVNYTVDEDRNWTIINATAREILLRDVETQKKVVFLIVIIVFAVLSILSFRISLHLTSSIKRVVQVMKKVSDGKTSARVEKEHNMPEEIETIATQFNNTMNRLEDSMQKERTASAKQRDAEIKFLEAQINPHFLYNTLDTINWMAIDADQYNISNAISSLAGILRYGIENNNRRVPLSMEIDWLKKYVFLQQSRLKSPIDCRIHVDPGAMNCRIHKLLLQPFVENAIIHGFEGGDKQFILEISIKEIEEKLEITISDNGKGMEKSVLESLRSEQEDGRRSHIGVKNAIDRVKMYYGESAGVKITSTPGHGTVVIIEIPKTEGEGAKDENCNC